MEAEQLTGPIQDFFDATTGEHIDDFCTALEGPEDFAAGSETTAQRAKLCLKALYDFTFALAERATPGGLPQLYVDGFDTEQIWGQLEASSGPALRHLRKRFRSLTQDFALIDAATEEALDELLRTADGGEASGSDTFEDSEVSLGEPEDPEVDMESQEGQPPKKRRRSIGQHPEGEERELLPTEDKFLRLDDMERFVQDAEAAKIRQASSDQDENDEEQEDESGSDMMGLNSEALNNPEQSDPELESDSDEEDAELARLLESAAATAGVGRRAKKRVKFDGDAEEEEGDQDYYYSDFFGPGGPRREDAQLADGMQPRHDKGQKNDPGNDLGEGEDSSDQSDEGQSREEEDEEDELGLDGGALGEDEDNTVEGDGRKELLEGLQTLLDQKRAEEAGVAVKADLASMSAHERRLARMAERAKKLEEENLGEKQWFMRGEAKAGARPLNSALEIDMDFDRALKPPPQPTEEFTSSLEDLIKRRIGEQQFDDPVKRQAPPDVLQKEFAALDDKQSAKGLGEVYEEEFVRARAGNTVDDKDEKTRSEARLVLKSLFAKLDALSHFHFAPKPIIKDMSIQREVPALAIEEVAPQVLSEADRQLPEEVYQAPASKNAKEDQPQGRSERKRRRAAAKRLYKKKAEGQDKVASTAANGGSNIIGRKSAQDDAQALAAQRKARLKEKRKKSKLEDGPKRKYTKSAAVFRQIEDAKARKASKKSDSALASSALKL